MKRTTASATDNLSPWGRGSDRQSYWQQSRRSLREVGDVTVVLSKRRRHDSPKHTKVLVTNLL
jgi:hypothetical protein